MVVQGDRLPVPCSKPDRLVGFATVGTPPRLLRMRDGIVPNVPSSRSVRNQRVMEGRLRDDGTIGIGIVPPVVPAQSIGFAGFGTFGTFGTIVSRAFRDGRNGDGAGSVAARRSGACP
jgi:hypothetical protein